MNAAATGRRVGADAGYFGDRAEDGRGAGAGLVALLGERPPIPSGALGPHGKRGFDGLE